MSYKPVDTAIVMVVGPLVDDTDFKSLEESVAYNAAGMDVSLIVEKTDGTSAVTAITLTSGGGSDWNHKDGGYYEIEVTAAQNTEEGIGFLRGICTGVLPFESPRYDIRVANVYDSLEKGTDKLQVDVRELGDANLALTTQMKADVNAECDTALTSYDSPTKAEADASFNLVITDTEDLQTQVGTAGVGLTNLGGMSTGMKAEVNAECATALTDYDAPTKAEMDVSFNALNDVSSGDVTTACTSSLNTYDPPTKTEMDTSFNAVTADTEDIQTQIGTAGVGLHNLGGMSVAMMGEVQTEVNDALLAQNLDHLVKDPVDTSFANTVHLNSVIGNMTGVGGSATFSRSTDSAEAIRNRGDTAWTTGGAGSISEILNVQALIPNSIDLADTATVRIALGLTNMVDDLPSTAEIAPGTITIDRKAMGATSWTTVVDASANSELAGLVYYDEVFDVASGYAAGDSIRITFKSQKITVDANDFEITGTDGWTFQTHIREAMVGTDDAPTKAEIDVSFNSVITEVNANETKIDALNDLSSADVTSSCTSSLNTYDAPTKSEMDTSFNSVITEIDANETKIDTIDGNVDSILLDTGTDGVVVASGSKTGYELSATGVTAVHDEIIEGTLTARQMKRIDHAALAGESTGGGTATLTFRDDADAKARITATVDSNGNRTNVTKDGA